MTMVHDRDFMGDTIKLEHCLQQKSSQKDVLQLVQKIRKLTSTHEDDINPCH